MTAVMRFPRMFRQCRPDPAAGGELECEAMIKCWREIKDLNSYAQIRVLSHLREMADERAQIEMREMADERAQIEMGEIPHE